MKGSLGPAYRQEVKYMVPTTMALLMRTRPETTPTNDCAVQNFHLCSS